MTVVPLGATGPSATVTAADAGKLFVLTGAETLVFDNVDLTGRRFEIFNKSGAAQTISFTSPAKVNGGLTSISIPAFSHVVVMGIGLGDYIAWLDSVVSSPS
jgi:hypothetical protein